MSPSDPPPAKKVKLNTPTPFLPLPPLLQNIYNSIDHIKCCVENNVQLVNESMLDKLRSDLQQILEYLPQKLAWLEVHLSPI
jgi:hypothetical protein